MSELIKMPWQKEDDQILPRRVDEYQSCEFYSVLVIWNRGSNLVIQFLI